MKCQFCGNQTVDNNSSYLPCYNHGKVLILHQLDFNGLLNAIFICKNGFEIRIELTYPGCISTYPGCISHPPLLSYYPKSNDTKSRFYHYGHNYSLAKTGMEISEDIIPKFNNDNLEKQMDRLIKLIPLL